MRKWIIAVVAIVIVAVGGYLLLHGNDNSNTQTSLGTTANPDNSTPNKTSSSTNTNSVTIADFAFSPNDITVKKGMTVTWTNKDTTAHTITESDGQTGPESGQVAPGATYSFTYASTGTFKYRCSIHPMMTGQVTVVE